MNHLSQNSLATAQGEIKRLAQRAKPYVTNPTVMVMALMSCSMAAHAITAPAAGSFAYDIYDVGVNKMIKGAPGFVGGMITVIVSAINITKNWLLAGGGILGGTALIKADSITTSLGALI